MHEPYESIFLVDGQLIETTLTTSFIAYHWTIGRARFIIIRQNFLIEM